MQRRSFVKIAALAPWMGRLNAAPEGRLLAQAYVWQQWANQHKKKLGEAIEEIFPATHRAGYHRMELTSVFFTPDICERTISLAQASGIDVPILYHGGALHESAAADKTIAEALEYAEAAKKLGVKMVNTNANPKPGNAAKTDDELAVQAKALNTFGEKLHDRGLRFELHSHAPELAQNAREWRYMLTHTDPKLVFICADVHWLFRGGQDPYALLEEAGKRVASLHLRNSVNKVWSESFGEGDIDYSRIAAILRKEKIRPYLAVELAYEKDTQPVHPLEDDLRDSRVYAEKVFGAAYFK
jgi:inosose dehydratase